jgi:site-specific recombinase XerD
MRPHVSAVRVRRVAARAGARRRFAPHQLRHAHALGLAREAVHLNIFQHQLGHASRGTTSIHLQGIDPEEIIASLRTAAPDHGRPRVGPAMMQNSAQTGAQRVH